MHISKIHIEEINNLKQTSVFNSKEWISIYNSHNSIELLGIFNKNNELIGFFYYKNHKRAKLLNQISPPFLSPHCGLYFEDNTINPAQKNTFKKNILQAILVHLKQLKYDILTLPFPESTIDMQSFIWSGFEVSPKYTYQIDLTQDEDDILAKMSPERRKNIKKAKKDTVLAQFSLKNKDSQKLIKNTFIQQKMHYDQNILNAIFTNFNTKSNSISFTSYHESTPLATVFCIYDKEVAYYILGGYNKDNRHEGAGALAMWEAIKHAKSIGVKVFDFEGSMHPPIEKYFRGFGGEIKPFFTVIKKNYLGIFFLKIRK
jgi:lipid II:glycine glycyltransferase (peptidoglycan interpeptide bridge formation enzyme)